MNYVVKAVHVNGHTNRYWDGSTWSESSKSAKPFDELLHAVHFAEHAETNWFLPCGPWNFHVGVLHGSYSTVQRNSSMKTPASSGAETKSK